jgi:hypothetical protein
MRRSLAGLSLVSLLQLLRTDPALEIELEIAEILQNSWRVDLSNQNLTHQDLKNLFKAALYNQRQGTFVLRGNKIDVEGAKIIAEFARKTPVIEFDLRDNHLGDEGVLILRNLYKSGRILYLNVRNNKVSRPLWRAHKAFDLLLFSFCSVGGSHCAGAEIHRVDTVIGPLNLQNKSRL